MNLLAALRTTSAVLPAAVIAGAITVQTASAQVQPELSKFAPVTEPDLVDPFTGDFRYSVPVLEVPGPNGGYPIVLTYASGIAPDQDASWVGLGWTLSPGAIVRQMRGIPDDFDGDSPFDYIGITHDIEPNVTYGLGLTGNYEIFGADTSVGTGLTAGLTGHFDNYRGFGITHTIGLSAQTKNQGLSAGIGLNLSEDTLEGAKVGASGSLSLGDNFRFSADTAFDSSRGLSALSFTAGAKYQSASFLVSSGNVLTYLGYAKPAALPPTPREMQGSNIKVSFKVGGEVYGNYISGSLFGYYNIERVRSTLETKTQAYGFMHLDRAGEAAAVDFNRERDGALYAQTPNLAMPVLTHDLFVVSGRDVVGTFRAYRNDVPVVFDPQQKSEMSGGAVGIDVGFGNVIKVGVSGALNTSSTVIQRWEAGGGETLLKDIRGAFVDDPSGYRERTYFKFIGEPSFAQASIVSGGVTPVAPTLEPAFDPAQMPPTIYEAGLPALVKVDDARTPRATLVQAFTNAELGTMANALPDVAADAAALLSDSGRAANHIGAFRITTTAGARYVYGIAVYNTKYEEHKFSVDRSQCPAGGAPCTIVKPPASAGSRYDYGVKGSEKMLEIRSIAPYPTSYLLTAVLGADYIDTDSVPGPSDGDYGYWVKFSYVRDQDAQGALRPFKWRIPFVGASFVRGPDNGRFVDGSERFGDVGSVTFGERESWYLASIETATHKAFMCVSRSDRRDAIGAEGATQNAPPTTGFAIPWKLTSIRLFSKAALAGRRPDASTNCPSGVALVESHLEYDTSLAKATPNATNGKLTLKKVYSTHLESKRGQLSPYEFEYEDATTNAPNYNPSFGDANRDRWNSYRDASAACGPPLPTGTAPAPVPGEDNPATCQDRQKADGWASAWTLRRIVEPSGRVLRVDYEADDYAYVQDRPVARLFPLLSVNASTLSAQPPAAARICPVRSNGSTPTCNTSLNRAGSAASRSRVFFKLDAPCTLGTAACNTWVEQHYLEPSRQLYFKIRVALKNGADPDPPGARPGSAGKWQTISGYAHGLGAGIVDGTTNVGWVELEPVHSNYPGSIDYHPFAHAAWQYLRLQQPELIREGGINGDPNGNALEEAVRVLTLVEAVPDLIEMFSGVYPVWAGKGWGQFIDLEYSWIRLRDPDGIKVGGGVRVRQITFSDGWNASTAGQESDLATGFSYSYRLEDGRSSGVASYEPMVGGEENPLRQPKPFADEVLLSSNYNLFAEMPIGESHYPAPTVGYARVVRHSLAAITDLETSRRNDECTKPDPNRRPTSIGPTVYEFFTARDFPVRSAESPILKARPPVPQLVLIPLLGEITMNVVYAAQGYSTILNDMHGKQRRVTSYEYTTQLECSRPDDLDYVVREEPVKETTFSYRSSGGIDDSPFVLANTSVPTLVDDPKPQPKNIAEQMDFVVDLRQNKTESFDGGINLNVDTFLVALYPLPIPVPMPNFGYSLSETKTVVTSRVVHEAGLLESVTVREGSAKVTTRTSQHDPLTGAPLLSDSDNAYGGTIYSYSMPARWTYARMGAGYEDVGRQFDLSGTLDAARRRLTTSTPLAICSERPPQPDPRCLPLGTELAAPSSAGGARLTLLSGSSSGAVFALEGDANAPLARSVVVRSGNRNMLTSSTDSIRALANPLGKRALETCVRSDRTITQFRLPNVLDASHTTFGDAWDIVRDLGTRGSRDEYATGLRGIFRPSKQYVYLTERSRSNPIDLSKDGIFDLLLFGRDDEPSTCEGWLRQITNNRYSASGFVTEKVNAISVPSASLYGSRGRLVFAVAGNAKEDEIGFDGFETSVAVQGPRGTYQASEGNISFWESSPCVLCPPTPYVSLTSDWAHTGRRSLLVADDAKFDQKRLRLTGGKTYLVSAWVSLGRPNTPATDVPTFAQNSNRYPVGIRISQTPGTAATADVLATLVPDGPIVDGWQRIEATFVVPQAATPLTLEFLAGNRPAAPPRPVYFDDVRIQPDDASLQGFVYDPDTLRMTATLDENNFATFYRYTPDGNVDLVRRETVRGVLAVQEGRLHTRERP